MSSESQLFIVANLAQPLRMLSIGEVEKLIVEEIQDLRIQKKIMPLQIIPNSRLHGLACDMAKKDSLKVSVFDPYMDYIASPSDKFETFTFATMDPGNLPNSVKTMGHEPKINSLSVGTCFASSPTHPQGTYWVIVVLYNTKRFR